MEKEKYKFRNKGRPLQYKRATDLQEAVDKYFNTTPKNEWTVTGLAMALGMTRQRLIEYGNREKYSRIVERAKLMIENGYEIDLKQKGHTGSIFALKAMGWSDRRELDVTSKGNQVLGNTIVIKSMDKDEAGS